MDMPEPLEGPAHLFIHEPIGSPHLRDPGGQPLCDTKMPALESDEVALLQQLARLPRGDSALPGEL